MSGRQLAEPLLIAPPPVSRKVRAVLNGKRHGNGK
jgi:hypothetical protein